MKRQRILYAAPGLVVRPGCGPTEHFLSLARCLARCPEVDLELAIGGPPRIVGDAGMPDVPIHWIPQPPNSWTVNDSLALGSHPLRYFKHRGQVKALAQQLAAKGAFDAVVERMWGFGGHLGRTLQNRGVHWVIEENGPPSFELRQRKWTDAARLLYLNLSRRHLRLTYSAADALVVQTEPLRTDLAQRFAVAEQDIHVIPNAVDPELLQLDSSDEARQQARRRLNLPADQTLLLYCGSVDLSHPVIEVVDAFLKLAPERPSHHMIVMGAGFGMDEIRRRQGPALPALRVMDEQPQARLRQYLVAADLILAPYNESLCRQGGFYFSPLKVREALAVNRPVAVTRGAEGSLVEDGVNGFLVAGQEGWMQLLATVPAAAELARLGEGNRERVQSYTYQDVASRYLEVCSRRDPLSP